MAVSFLHMQKEISIVVKARSDWSSVLVWYVLLIKHMLATQATEGRKNLV